MAKSFKIGNAILCEYAAKGERNKHNLVNVYSGDVVVGKMPATLLFGLFIEIIPNPTLPQEIRITVKLDKKKLFGAKAEHKSAETGRPLAFVIPSMQVQIEEDTVIGVFLSGDGYRSTKALSKKIFKDSTLTG